MSDLPSGSDDRQATGGAHMPDTRPTSDAGDATGTPGEAEPRPVHAEEMRPRRNIWVWAALVVLAVLAITFVAGLWSADRNERAVAKVVAAYAKAYEGEDSTKDVPALVPLYDQAAIMRDVATDRSYEGVARIETALNSLLATPGFDLSIKQTLVGDDWAVLSWTADGTKPATGRLTQVSGVTVLQVSKKKIVGETWYYDPVKAPF